MLVHYATVFDAKNIHTWSGLGYYIGKALENEGHTVQYLNDLQIKNQSLHKLKTHVLKKIFGKTYSPNFSPKVADQYAALIEQRVPKGSIILSPNTVILCNLNNSYKKVLFTDATFQRLLNFYPAFTKIGSKQIKQAQDIERKALQQCDLIIYSSQWAAESAIEHYNVNPSKIAIIPFGANIDFRISHGELLPMVERRLKRKEIHLVLIGVAWFRKGGEYAMEVLKSLNEAGIETKLHLVGFRKLPSALIMKNVINHGYISKSTAEGQRRIVDILKESNFLLLPSRADCTPVAVSEANSFGVPCLTSNVGGNHRIVSNEINGRIFDFTKGSKECCDYIISLKKQPEQYMQLCNNSYNRFLSELNWDLSGKKITELLNTL